MDINNNQQINTFSNGLDTDSSDFVIDEKSYRNANNIRLVGDKYGSNMSVQLIQGNTLINKLNDDIVVIQTGSVRDYGVIIAKNNNKLLIYITKQNNITDQPKLIFRSIDDYEPDSISINLRYESEHNIKLYMADGVHPLMSINIADDKYNGNYNPDNNILSLYIYPQVQFKKPIFLGLTTGTLAAGLYQYSYQLYKKFGNGSEISPTTRLIPVIDNVQYATGNDINGVKQDDNSGSGIRIRIPKSDSNSQLDRIKIYRIHYVQNGQQPTIEIVYDSTYTDNMIFVDNGVNALSNITLEEYNSISGVHIIPKVIDSKNDYLFAANIKEYTNDSFSDIDTRAYAFSMAGTCTLTKSYTTTTEVSMKDFTIQDLPLTNDCYNKSMNPNNNTNTLVDQMYVPSEKFNITTGDSIDLIYGGFGKIVSYALITTEIDADTCKATDNDQFDINYDGHTITFNNQPIGTQGMSIGRDKRIDPINFNKIRYGYISYSGNIISTDKDGNPLYCDLTDFVSYDNEDKLWTYGNPKISYSLKSLRRGELYRYGIILYDKYGNASSVKWIADIKIPELYIPGFEPFISHGYTEYDNRIDLKVRPIGIQFKVDLSDEKYNDIISYEIVRCNRSESDVRNVTQGVISRSIIKNTISDDNQTLSYPYTPSGWLTTAKYWIGDDYCYRLGVDNTKFEFHGIEADNFSNNKIYQFVSPEVSYMKDDTYDIIKNKQIQLQPLLYMFGISNGVPNKRSEESTDKESPFQTIDNFTCKDLNNPDRYISRYINPSPSNCHIRLSSFSRDNSYNNGSYGDISNITDWKRYLNTGKYLSGDTVMMNQGVFQYELFNRTIELEPQDPSSLSETLNSGSSCCIYSVTQSNGNRYPSNGWFIKGSNVPTSFLLNNYYKYIYEDNNFVAVRDYSYSYIKLYNFSKDVFYNPKYTTDSEFSNQTTIYRPSVDFYNIIYDIDDVAESQDYNWNEFTESQEDNISPKYNTKLITVGNVSYNNYVTGGCYGELKYIEENSENDEYPYKQLTGAAGSCLILNLSNHSNDQLDILSQTSCCDNIISTQSHDNYINKLHAYEPNFDEGYPYNAISIKTSKGTKEIDHSKFVLSTQYGLSDKYVYKPSIFGTYLCNIQQTVTPYGGSSYLERQLNTYSSYGNYYNKNTNASFIFDGDTFISPFEYTSMHKMYDIHVKEPLNTAIMYSIPVESSINLSLAYGYEFSKNTNNIYSTNVQIEPGSVNNLLTQTDGEYEYNSAYSSNPTVVVKSAETEDDNDKSLNTYDIRCFYSNLKTNNESIDSWSIFKASDYFDVDPRYGEITNLRTFHNELLYWQDRAFGKFNVNEQSIITDQNNTNLILGTGGVLTRYDYMLTTNGMKKDQLCDAQSDTTLYWWDGNKREILGYSTGSMPAILSKLKFVQNSINKLQNEDKERPVVYYNKKYNDVMFDIFNKKSIIYNEQLQRFITFCDYNPKNTAKPIIFNTNEYIVDSTGIYLQNSVDGGKSELFGTPIYPSIEYVVNHNSTMVKVFDIQTFSGYFKDALNIDNTNQLYFKYNTKSANDFNYQHSETTGKNVVNLEYDYRLTIPRNNNEQLGNRMRGKTLDCTIGSYSNSQNFALQYITTKYRISWI